MPQIVEVNGEPVEFPDGMSDEQIAAAIRGQGRMIGLEGPQAGVGEVALQMGTSALATPLAGLAGIGAAAIPGGRTGPQAVEDVTSALTYQPRSEAGQTISRILGQGFGKIESLADTAGEVTGDPEDTVGATAVKTALLGAPAVFGLRSGPRTAPSRAIAARRPPPPPTVPELFRQGSQAFRRAEGAGVVVAPRGINRLFERVQGVTKGIDDTLHPDSSAALRRIAQEVDAGPLTFERLNILRQIAADARGSTRPADARFAGRIVNEIDNFIDDMKPADVFGGDTAVAASAIKEARNLWSRARKGEEIERLIDKAGINANTYTGAGFENALRVQFRQLARNDKKIRMFTPEEQAAIRRVAMGGSVENALRALGKLAPTGVVSTGLSTGLSGYLLGNTFGPAGAAVLPIAGLLGREGATRMTIANANRAAEIARRGPLGQ